MIRHECNMKTTQQPTNTSYSQTPNLTPINRNTTIIGPNLKLIEEEQQIIKQLMTIFEISEGKVLE